LNEILAMALIGRLYVIRASIRPHAFHKSDNVKRIAGRTAPER
jgi:hypothetical protein